ncbi:MFS transporter [Streptomyces sp. bgisy153]|uniref:MFS transporter n=1 Tax=Streptomyces sp. bgisy153 TaxID=3413793 RepID=UPI003D70C6FB
MFRSLAVRNFRLFVVGQLFSVTGTWTMFVAQDWLVLSLSGDSGTQLAVVTTLQFLPVLLLTLHGGTLADARNRRRLLLAANATAAALSALVYGAAVAAQPRLWQIYVFAAAIGVVNAVEGPARLAFVGEMVGPDLLPNASALSGAYFNVARVGGPALAGLLIGRFGPVPVFALNAVSYAATVTSLLLMRESELHRPPGPRPRRTGGVRDGLAHVRGRRDLLLPLTLLACVCLFGFNFQLALPLLAKTEFGVGAESFGLLTSAVAAGSLAAALVTTARTGRPRAGVVIGAATAFGLCETGAGLTPTFASTLPALAAVGFTATYFAQATNHHVQLGTDRRYRGRVIALYLLILQGAAPLGSLPLSRLIELLGPRAALWTGGTLSLTAAVTALCLHRAGTRRTRSSTEKAERPRPDSNLWPLSIAGDGDGDGRTFTALPRPDPMGGQEEPTAR